MPYLPGLKPVLEMLANSPESISRVYHSSQRQDAKISQLREMCSQWHIPLEEITPRELNELCGSHVAHQGVVAAISGTREMPLPELLANAAEAPLPLLLALDQVRDPGNVGAISRTAWAMGCAGLILPRHNSAELGAGAFKSSAGALARLPVTICANLSRALDTCEEEGFSIYGAAAGANAENAFTFHWRAPAVLVLGSEEKGIRPGVLKRCQSIVAIPMARPFDSLNVAQAGAMLLALCAANRCTLRILSD